MNNLVIMPRVLCNASNGTLSSIQDDFKRCPMYQDTSVRLLDYYESRYGEIWELWEWRNNIYYGTFIGLGERHILDMNESKALREWVNFLPKRLLEEE